MTRINTFKQALILIGCCLSIAAFILTLYKYNKCNKCNKLPVKQEVYELYTASTCGNCAMGDGWPDPVPDNPKGNTEAELTLYDKLALKIADVAYYGSRQYPNKVPPGIISGYSKMIRENCWQGGVGNNLFTIIYNKGNDYLIGVQGTESFMAGSDSNLGVDFDILIGDFRVLEKLARCVATFINTTIREHAPYDFDSANIIIGGHSLGGTIIMTIFMLAAVGVQDCMDVISKIGPHKAILVNPFIGILPYMVQYTNNMQILHRNGTTDKLRMIVHPGDPASAFWRLYTTTDKMCPGNKYDTGQTLFYDLSWMMTRDSGDEKDLSHLDWDFTNTVLRDQLTLKNVFKLSTWNGGCNGVCWSNTWDSQKPDKWCLNNHGLVAYTSSHSYGTSWMKIIADL